MPTNSGNIILNTYNINHTLSGTCAGYINQLSVSGGTSPYSILWSGMTTYSANTFATDVNLPQTLPNVKIHI